MPSRFLIACREEGLFNSRGLELSEGRGIKGENWIECGLCVSAPD